MRENIRGIEKIFLKINYRKTIFAGIKINIFAALFLVGENLYLEIGKLTLAQLCWNKSVSMKCKYGLFILSLVLALVYC